MKIKNIFKKENKTAVKANVEKLEKNQLEKVVGGADNKSRYSLFNKKKKPIWFLFLYILMYIMLFNCCY